MQSLSQSRSESRRRSDARVQVDFLRMLLISEVLRVIKARRLSAKDVSQVLDVPESRVSALLHGEIREFVIDDLMRMTARTGVELALTKTSPVDEETFDGPLCRASGAGLYDTVRSRLAAMVARLGPQEAGAPGAPREGATIEALVERLGDAGVRLIFTSPL